ncbi:MAG: DoxX family protein [Candidatus Pacebacteria bacterium]|nr:DoxX family protein [Candidatus Paceibacterota bacterium]
MTHFHKLSLFLLRITMGWMFFYAGITHLLDPNFSAGGYLAGAKTFVGFYHFLATPSILPIVNFVNVWGLTLLGVSLILGIGVRLSAKLGALLMVLYWLPLGILHPDAHSLIVDDHIIYAAGLLVLAYHNAGRAFGFQHWFSGLSIFSKYPRLRDLLG